MPTDYDVMRMAAFTALNIARDDDVTNAQAWLAGVCDEPTKWHAEAQAFNVLVDGRYTFEQAGAAINAALTAGAARD